MQYVIFFVGLAVSLLLGAMLPQEPLSLLPHQSQALLAKEKTFKGLDTLSSTTNNTTIPCVHNIHTVFTPKRLKIEQPKEILSAHSVSADYLANGDIFAVWFAGSREGAKDVKIFSARYQNDQWSTPQAITDVARTTLQTGRYQRKVGNPSIIHHRGTLYLFYVAVSVGGWAGSRLFVKTSTDQGLHWSSSKILYSNAFFNLSTLVHHRPIALNERYLLIPAYHELMFKNPEWIIFDVRLLEIVDRYRPDARGYLQPAFNRSRHNIIQAWYRVSAPLQYIGYQSWDIRQTDMPHTAVPTSYPNPNAGIASDTLTDSCTLLVLNPQFDSRRRLALLKVCEDPPTSSIPITMFSDHTSKGYSPNTSNGSSPFLWLENVPDAQEFSYPAVLQQDDKIDVLYTWKRKTIAHQRIPKARMMQNQSLQAVDCSSKP